MAWSKGPSAFGRQFRPEDDQPLAEAERAYMYCVYFARSLKNNKIYVGFTSKEPDARIREHNSGSSVWSKQNKPLVLVYFERYFCKQDAFAREQFFKTGIGKKIKSAIIRALEAES